MGLTATCLGSGIGGVFAVMVFLQIMIALGSAFAKFVEGRAAAKAEKKAELAARKARLAKRAAAAK